MFYQTIIQNKLLQRFFLICTCVCMLLTACPVYAETDSLHPDSVVNWPEGPSVLAESAILMDLDSNVILFNKNIDEIQYPASITKIMTALVALEHSQLTEEVTFSQSAVYGIEAGSSHLGIKVGEVLTMEQCLYGLMLASANEVCLAVAEHISGSSEAFVELMNAKAEALGCTNTHFTNPNGLHDTEHYTTARDMAIIAKAAYDNPMFQILCQTTTYSIPPTNQYNDTRYFSNHHKMLPTREYEYEYCTGGKTGFTSAALNTLVTYGEKNDHRLVCVLLRANGAVGNYQDTETLLEYGFNNFDTIPLYDRSTTPSTGFLYPSLYYGCPTTLDMLLSDCFLTVPTATPSAQINVFVRKNEETLSKEYQYNGYRIGYQEVSTDAVRKLLNQSPSMVVTKAEKPEPTPEPPSVVGSYLLGFFKGTAPSFVYWFLAAVVVLFILFLLFVRYQQIQRMRKQQKRRRQLERDRQIARKKQAALQQQQASKKAQQQADENASRSRSRSRRNADAQSEPQTRQSTTSQSASRSKRNSASQSASRSKQSSASQSASRSKQSSASQSASRSKRSSASQSASRSKRSSASQSVSRSKQSSGASQSTSQSKRTSGTASRSTSNTSYSRSTRRRS